ncbi:hypothetical protein BWZ22_04305 [Seonamhaeicola sp. S2-3]|uniref:DUF6122 family protein n=1 Tax=Seonamhaeicola sp. S2-3 TaxID=1936081 RepID=UPI000972DB3B|nr:DUF6122 family protein [Seonamhaeicola sp. S2-3]APY10507.1 hypothetical protein BWZ22_04305 [Seonamhaeicola sp. S2-3]
MLQNIAHYGCHFLMPLLVAFIWFRANWKMAYLIMIAGMLIDLDHLLATPVFDPNRCSIGFHPLHSSFAILFYLFLLIPKKSRLVALGLVIHIIADVVDCSFMQ